MVVPSQPLSPGPRKVEPLSAKASPRDSVSAESEQELESASSFLPIDGSSSGHSEHSNPVNKHGQVIRVGDIVQCKGRLGIVSARSGTGSDSQVFVQFDDDESRFEESVNVDDLQHVDEDIFDDLDGEDSLGEHEQEERQEEDGGDDDDDDQREEMPPNDDAGDQQDHPDQHDDGDEDRDTQNNSTGHHSLPRDVEDDQEEEDENENEKEEEENVCDDDSLNDVVESEMQQQIRELEEQGIIIPDEESPGQSPRSEASLDHVQEEEQEVAEPADEQVETIHEVPAETIEEPIEEQGALQETAQEPIIVASAHPVIEQEEGNPEQAGQENLNTAARVERVNRLTEMMASIDNDLGSLDSPNNLEDEIQADINRLDQDQREETQDHEGEENVEDDHKLVEDLPHANETSDEENNNNENAEEVLQATLTDTLQTGVSSVKPPSSLAESLTKGWIDDATRQQLAELERVKSEAREVLSVGRENFESKDTQAVVEEPCDRSIAELVVLKTIIGAVDETTPNDDADAEVALLSARSQVQSEAADILNQYEFSSSPVPDELLEKHAKESARLSREEAAAKRKAELKVLEEELAKKQAEIDRQNEEMEKQRLEMEIKNKNHDSNSSLSPSLKDMKETPLADMFYKDVVNPITEDDSQFHVIPDEELLPSTQALIRMNIIPDPAASDIRSGIPKAKAKTKFMTRPKLPEGKTTSGEAIEEVQEEPIRYHPITGRPLARKSSASPLPPKSPKNKTKSRPQPRSRGAPAAVVRATSESPGSSPKSQGRKSPLRSPRRTESPSAQLHSLEEDQSCFQFEDLESPRRGRRSQKSSARGRPPSSRALSGVESASPERENELKEKLKSTEADEFERKEFAKEFTARMRRQKRELAKRKKQRILRSDQVLMQMCQNRVEEAERSLPDPSPPAPHRVRKAKKKWREASAGPEDGQQNFNSSGRQLVPPSELDENSPRKDSLVITEDDLDDTGRPGVEDMIRATMTAAMEAETMEPARHLVTDTKVSESLDSTKETKDFNGEERVEIECDDEEGYESPPPLMPLSPLSGMNANNFKSGRGRRHSPVYTPKRSARSRGRQPLSARSKDESPPPSSRSGLALAPPDNQDFAVKRRLKPKRPRSGIAIAKHPQPPEEEEIEIAPLPPPRVTKSVGRKSIPLYKRMEMEAAEREAAEQDAYKKKLLRKQMGPHMAREVLPQVQSPGRHPNRQRMHYAASVRGPSQAQAATTHTAQPEDIRLPNIHRRMNDYAYHKRGSCPPLKRKVMKNWLLRHEAPLAPGGPRMH